MIKSIIEKSRLFSILKDRVSYSSEFENELYNTISDYIDKYILFHNLEESRVIRAYQDFIRNYNIDLRKFNETGEYPSYLDGKVNTPSSIDYNLVLLLSTLLTEHRFRIMKLLQKKSVTSESSLFIGCGPGLELFLIREKIEKITAYDLVIDPFLHFFHSKSVLKNEYFDGISNTRFDSIFLIEILEHLGNPFLLLENCRKVLNDQGKIYLTTASNIPQFDHLYNFASDHILFDETLENLGFDIKFSEDIIHNSITLNVEAKNKFYIIEKS